MSARRPVREALIRSGAIKTNTHNLSPLFRSRLTKTGWQTAVTFSDIGWNRHAVETYDNGCGWPKRTAA